MRRRTVPITVLGAGLAGLGWAVAEARAFTLRRFTVPVLPAGQPRCACCTCPTCT